MTLGETALLKVRFDFAYSSYSMGANIPPRSNMIFKVSLLAVNEKNGRGMPYRQLKRFSRMVWRKSTFCARMTYMALMRIIKTKTFAYIMKKLFNIDIKLDEPEAIEYSSSTSEEEEEVNEVNIIISQIGCALILLNLQDDISLDTTVTPVFTDDDVRMKKHLTGAVVAGARGMWGFKTSTMPEIRVKRPRRPEELELIKRIKKKINV